MIEQTNEPTNSHDHSGGGVLGTGTGSNIGADSMGEMGAIAPMAKKLWERCPQVAPPEFCYVIF